jgi:hypothetical protein
MSTFCPEDFIHMLEDANRNVLHSIIEESSESGTLPSGKEIESFCKSMLHLLKEDSQPVVSLATLPEESADIFYQIIESETLEEKIQYQSCTPYGMEPDDFFTMISFSDELKDYFADLHDLEPGEAAIIPANYFIEIVHILEGIDPEDIEWDNLEDESEAYELREALDEYFIHVQENADEDTALIVFYG